ncbi:MAG: acyl-CoA thioesterase [Rikenellaceae bacterium]
MIRTKIQLRWNDIDALGHLYNGQYQHLYDFAKSDFIAQLLGVRDNWAQSDQGFVTVRTLNNYYSPVYIQEEIEILTTIRRVGSSSFDIFQRMVCSATGEVKSDSLSVMVCYNPKSGESYEIPTEAKKVMEREIALYELND